MTVAALERSDNVAERVARPTHPPKPETGPLPEGLRYGPPLSNVPAMALIVILLVLLGGGLIAYFVMQPPRPPGAATPSGSDGGLPLFIAGSDGPATKQGDGCSGGGDDSGGDGGGGDGGGGGD